jgi:hypothetical protein
MAGQIPSLPRFSGDINADFVTLAEYVNSLFVAIGIEGAAGAASVGPLPRGWIDGLTLSHAGGLMSCGRGVARADDDTSDLRLAEAITGKSLAAFGVGSGKGMLDQGVRAVNAWYHVFAIGNPTTGAVDVLASRSLEQPALPTGFSTKRRIGAIKTNASGQITPFYQVGDEFRWADPPLDLSVTLVGTAAVLAVLQSVPPDVVVQAVCNVIIEDGGQVNGLYISPVATNDEAVSRTAAPLLSANRALGSTTGVASEFKIYTDAQARIRYRAEVATLDAFALATLGWIDPRGRNAA